MHFADNPLYKVAYTHETGLVFYVPAATTEYHKSREMAMQVQDTYARCGISPATLTVFIDTLIQFANKQLNTDTLRTDIGTIANNMKYRMSNIVDEQCAIRMGALAVFIDGEEPDKVIEAWTAKKVRLAMEHPDLYSFFLHMGIAFTPTYSETLRSLVAEEYLMERKMILDSMTVK